MPCDTPEFTWVYKVIESCEHASQLEICTEIITLFKLRQPDVETAHKLDDLFHEMAKKLNYYQYEMVRKKEKIL